MLAIGMPIPMPIAGICIGMFIIGIFIAVFIFVAPSCVQGRNRRCWRYIEFGFDLIQLP